MKLIKVTYYNKRVPVYININAIISIQSADKNGANGLIICDKEIAYNVIETPEEIINLIKAANQNT